MRHVIIASLLLVLIAGTAAYWIYGGASAPPQPSTPSVQQRARQAYRDGNYAEALPLLKEWAATPEVHNDRNALGVAAALIADSEKQLKLVASGAAVQKPREAQVIAQAMASAAQTPATVGTERVPHKKHAPGEVVAMTIKQLGNFDFNPETDADVPADVHLLEGATVRLNGFMLPISQTEKISEFALVPSLMGCCFGQPPGVEHIIMARTPSDKGVDYAIEEIEVEGILHIRVKRAENYTSSIFELDVRSVRVKE